MEKIFDVIDLQQPNEKDVHYHNLTWFQVKEVAYIIMKDRSEGVNDELAEEFKQQIKNGVDGLEDSIALETLTDWGYEVVEKNVGKIKDKQYYIDCYNKRVEKYRDEHIEEYGNDDYFDSSVAEDYMEADEIVGYYLEWYKDEALNQWLSNLEGATYQWGTDNEVTSILTSIIKS